MLAAQVVLFSQSFDSFGFTYAVDPSLENILQKGNIVRVPFKNSHAFGVVFDIFPLDSSYRFEMKMISEISAPEMCLPSYILELITFLSKNYFSPIHHCLSLYFSKHLQTVIEKNTFHALPEKTCHYFFSSQNLSEKQNKIFHEILKSPDSHHLLYGVTGSGKTQIYIALIEHFLKKDKQVLLLIPEIILTSQISDRIQSYFGKDVVVLHSAVSAAKKTKIWKSLYFSEAKIIIGTRSALFYPYTKLGCIIMDEEHDQSFVSDVSPRYQSLQVAEKICSALKIPLILGSGTPKVTTLYRAIQGEFILHHLLEKYK